MADTTARPAISPREFDPVRWLNAGALVTAGALAGFGLMLWIAANWDDIGKWSRFALVGGALGACALGAAGSQKARVPLSLAGVMAIGGLLAVIGQTYQTGADNWQLFAIWAAVALPWAVAARSDTVWVAWVNIAYAALMLWWLTTAGVSWVSQTQNTLAVWLAAMAIALTLSTVAGLRPWIGNTKWAFRLAAIMLAAVVAGPATAALFDLSNHGLILAVGFLIISGSIVAITWVRPLDVPLLVVFVLALDVLLIAGLIKTIFFTAGSRAEIGGMLVTGLLSAAIVAVSAGGVLNVIRNSHDDANGQAGRIASDTLAEGKAWPVVIMTFIGALIAAIPLLIFLGMMFGTFFEKGAGAYVAGGAMLAGSAAILRGSSPLGFRQQFGIISLVLAFLALGFAFYRDTPGIAASLLLLAISVALAFAIESGWIKALLGALAVAFAAFAVNQIFATLNSGRAVSVGIYGSFSGVGWTYALLAGSAAMIALQTSYGQSWRERVPDSAGKFLSGWIAAALLVQIWSTGNTFMLGSWWGAGFGGQGAAVALPSLNHVSVLLISASLFACYWLQRCDPRLLTMTGYALVALLIVLTLVAPGIGGPALAFAAAATSGRRALATLAAFAVLWKVGAFYYAIGWPLADKAMLMLGLGAGLALVAWRNASSLTTFASAEHDRGWGLAAAAMILASLLGAGAAAAHSIFGYEHILKTGRTAYIALGQQDPRSLIQGDYMTLSFRIPSEAIPAPPAFGQVTALATLDEKNVATFQTYRAPITAIAANEIAVNVVRRGWTWSIGTNAWFFKENASEKLAKARFGEFRVSATGEALLVGLADENLQPVARAASISN